MFIEDLKLINFRNYEELQLSFSNKINCFLGLNGAGKTNLLDSIYYLSLTKSAFHSKDAENIRKGSSSFSIKGDFLVIDRHHQVLCSFQAGQSKIFKTDGKEYSKLSDHIGKFPVVMIAPNDTDVIREHSEARRKFFDGILSQINKEYLRALISYKQNLKQRNALLKQFAEKGSVDKDLLSPYNKNLVNIGVNLYQKRKNFLEEFLPVLIKQYEFLAGKKESVNIVYKTTHSGNFNEELLLKSLSRDIMYQRTTMGVHRDDFIFTIDANELKKYGSQGQQKSFLIALKMAQFEIIKKEKKFEPILLLDDIFDKLDEERITKLLKMVAGKSFGQLFITDARMERTKTLLDARKFPVRYFLLEDNRVLNLK